MLGSKLSSSGNNYGHVTCITSHVTYLVNKHAHKSEHTKDLVSNKQTKYKATFKVVFAILFINRKQSAEELVSQARPSYKKFGLRDY